MTTSARNRRKAPFSEELAEGVELWLGDCTEVLPLIEARGHIISDPPYEESVHRAKDRSNVNRTDGGPALRPLTFDSIEKIRPVVAPMMIERCDGWLIAFCSSEGIAAWRDALEDAGAKYKRACFWHKPDAAPQFNGQGPGYAVEPFVTAWCGSGYSRWNGGGRRNLFEHPTNGRDRDGTHETEKPLSLMGEIVTLFTDRGQLVIDPFMGSGTTGVAAVKSGRRFIGIEKDPDYYATAKRRILAALNQPDLFVPIPKPEQVSLTAGWPKQRKGAAAK